MDRSERLALLIGFACLSLCLSVQQSSAQRLTTKSGGKVAKSTATDAPTPSGIVDTARRAYVEGNFRDAISLAQKLLKKDPENQAALRLTTAAWCRQGEKSKAKASYERLAPHGRRLARELCSRVGVRLPSTVTRQVAAPVKSDKALMAEAEMAFMASQHSRAIAAASEMAQRIPRHQHAYRIIAVSACYLGYRSLALQAQTMLKQKERALAQQVCTRLGL